MAVLYINSRGEEITRHSYSAGLEFDQSPYKFYLNRVLGWRPKDTKAALLFGRALEDAVQFHHENNGQGAIAEFERIWAGHAGKKLVYTAQEVSWESLMRAGREMIQLYQIKQPSLPIPFETRFQRQFYKEVFPNDEKYGGIQFYGKLDMVAYPEPNHPLLPKVNWNPAWGLVRPLIVDMKTAGAVFDNNLNQVGWDLQLRMYAWLTGIYDVAFLWFKKAGHKIEKGSNVTLLHDAIGGGRIIPAGVEVVVAYAKDGDIRIALDDNEIEEMNEAQGRKNGKLDGTKAAEARKMAWLDQKAIRVESSAITRQRIQFVSAHIDRDSAEDAGQIAADQIVRIVAAWESNRPWLKKFGVRYPHNDSNDPYFKAFVLKDNVFRDATFEQRVEEDLAEDEVEELQQEAVQ